MPEEFDNSDVKVVDTIEDNDDVDFNEEDIGEDDSSSSGGGSSSNNDSSGKNDVPTVEGDNGIEQAVPSVEDPETGKEVRIDNPAVGNTGEQGDRVRTGQLTDGRRREVIVEGPGGSGVEAAPAAPKLAEERIKERTQNLKEQRETKKSNNNQNKSNRQNQINARQKLFRRERRETREQAREFFGLEAVDNQRDFGTIDDPSVFRERRLEEQSNLNQGELDILRTAAQQQEFTSAARRGGRQLTNSELGGKIAVAGQDVGIGRFFSIDQGTSIANAVSSDLNEVTTLPRRTAEGAPIVAREIIENPIEEGLPEVADLATGGGASVSVSTSTTPTFIDESSSVIGSQSTSSTNTVDNTLSQENVPSNERLPDLGEQSLGEDPRNTLNEPNDVLRDPGVRESPTRAQQRNREPGVPEQEEGFTQEEVEVLLGREPRLDDVQQGSETGGVQEVFTPQKRIISDSSVDPNDPGVTLENLRNAVSNRKRGSLQLTGRTRPKGDEIFLSPDIPDFRPGIDNRRTSDANIIDNSLDNSQSRDKSRGRSQDRSIDVGQGIISGSSVGTTSDVRLDEFVDTGQSQQTQFGLDEALEQNTQQETTNTQDSTSIGSTQSFDFNPDQVLDTGQSFTEDSSFSSVSTTVEPDQQNQNTESGFFDLLDREQERDVQRSVGADILGLQDSNLTEEEATNPLSLRALDQN